MKTSRRKFLAEAGVASLAASTIFSQSSCSGGEKSPKLKQVEPSPTTQRLSVERLKEWQDLKYGMFLCFGMSTYLGEEFPKGGAPVERYDPVNIDVDQWIRVAKEVGMKYVVLTAKHVAGHCLWPSAYTDYSVKHNKNNTDVVKEFVAACHKYDIKPCMYYCSWDNYHTFGSITPSTLLGEKFQLAHKTPTEQEPLEGAPFTTSLYQNFMTAQINELLDNYGPYEEFWIDIPGVLGNGYRKFLYDHIAEKFPEMVIVMNHGQNKTDGEILLKPDKIWPSDVLTMERYTSKSSYNPIWNIAGKDRYMPGETCMTLGKEWYWVDKDIVKPMDELLESFQTCLDNKINFLLSVSPDKNGEIPEKWIKPLMELKEIMKI